MNVRRKEGVPCIAGALKGFCKATKCVKKAATTTGVKKTTTKAMVQTTLLPTFVATVVPV